MEVFRIKKYPHFDAPLTKIEAEKLVASPDRIVRHPFYPLLQTIQGWSKFAKKGAQSTQKRRKIRYSARRDSCIFSHYRQLLLPLYELELDRLGLQDCVLAYRNIRIPGKKSGKCNIHFAAEAFKQIRDFGDCSVIALDIEDFFENLDHEEIKRKWSHLIGATNNKQPLPPDHFAVFKAVTHYSWIERDSAYKALGLIGEAQDANGCKRIKYLKNRKDFPVQICKPAEFRGKLASLIQENCNSWGIPQGLPISDLLANLYMIDFDLKLNAKTVSVSGKYFRYSDDILLVLPGADFKCDQMLKLVNSTLAGSASRLKIKGSKTQVYEYKKLSTGPDQCAVNIGATKGADGLEYLGFRYDGRRIFLRNRTFSGFRRKIAKVAERMANNHVLFHPNQTVEELVNSFNYDVLFKKFGRVRDFDFVGSEYTKWTFWTYIQRCVQILGPMSSPILRQVNDYKSFARKRAKRAIQKAYKHIKHP